MRRILLLIDNDKNVLSAFEEIINRTKGSFKCTFADSAEQALRLSTRLLPDFIFVCYNLSNTNGLQFLSAIRQVPKLSKTKVFVYSDNIGDETSKLARMLGAAGCIEKSNNVNTLFDQLKLILAEELIPDYAFS